MRIGIASPANSLALAPCQFEIAEEHIHIQRPAAQRSAGGPQLSARRNRSSASLNLRAERSSSPRGTSLSASYPPVALIVPPFGRVDTMRSIGRSFDWLPAAKIHFLFRVGFDAESCRTKHGLHARTIRN